MEHTAYDTETNLDAEDLFAPANDNRRSLPSERRVPRYVTEGQTDVLLALAGFDPDKVPRKLHAGALRVAWCHRHGLFGFEAVATAAGLSTKKLHRTLAAMRGAEKGRAA